MGRCSSCKSKKIERLQKTLDILNGVTTDTDIKDTWYNNILTLFYKLLVMALVLPISIVFGVAYSIILMVLTILGVKTKFSLIPGLKSDVLDDDKE